MEKGQKYNTLNYNFAFSLPGSFPLPHIQRTPSSSRWDHLNRHATHPRHRGYRHDPRTAQKNPRRVSTRQRRISEFTSYDEKSEAKNTLLWAYSSGNGRQFVEWETKENSISSTKGVSAYGKAINQEVVQGKADIDG